MAPSTSTFPLTGPINLHAKLGHGRITVTALDDLTEATVAISSRRPMTLEKDAPDEVVDRITVELRGPTLFISAPRQGTILDMIGGWRGDRDAVDVDVRVPSGTALKIATFTADVVVVGRCGGADIATGGAAITLEHVDGDLLLRYGKGTSDVRRVDGSVTLRSGSGNAKLGQVSGGVQAGCGSGRLEVDSIRGTVRSRAGSGDAVFNAVYGDVDLASGSGTMSIGLPAGIVARLDATTGSGRVDTDLPVEDNPRSGGPTITVRARTGSGDIRVFRAA
jgi:hypothetical protein